MNEMQTPVLLNAYAGNVNPYQFYLLAYPQGGSESLFLSLLMVSAQLSENSLV